MTTRFGTAMWFFVVVAMAFTSLLWKIKMGPSRSNAAPLPIKVRESKTRKTKTVVPM